MKLSQFKFKLPEDKIALHPATFLCRFRQKQIAGMV